MRTFKATLLFLAVFFLVTPAPAQAWFGWLDDLSGPGPFWGEQYEVRVACIGDVRLKQHFVSGQADHV